MTIYCFFKVVNALGIVIIKQGLLRLQLWQPQNKKGSVVALQVKVVSEPERIGVFLTRSCVHVTDISCGVVYEATLASLVLFRSYCYVSKGFFGTQAVNVSHSIFQWLHELG